MKKRLICLLVTLCCFVCSFAAAENHILLEGRFLGLLDGNTVSAEAYEADGKTRIVSSLVPDHVVTADTASEKWTRLIDLLRYLRPDYLSDAADFLHEEICAWFSDRNAETRTGLFAGDLFTEAKTEKQWDVHTADLLTALRFIRRKAESSQETGTNRNPLILKLIDYACAVAEEFSDGPLSFRLKSYDEGKYLVFEVSGKGGILLTVSADYSAGTEKRFLICHAENGKTYYQLFRLSGSGQQTDLNSALYSSSVPSFYSAADGKPVLSEQFIWKTAENGNSASFEITIDSGIAEESLIIRGTAEYAEEKDSVDADVYFKGSELEGMKVRIEWDGQTIPEETAKQKELDLRQPEQANEIQRILMANMAILAAGVIPSLPVSYQKMINTLLFKK